MVIRKCDICSSCIGVANYRKPPIHILENKGFICGESIALPCFDTIDLCPQCLHEKQTILTAMMIQLWNDQKKDSRKN